MGRPERGMGKLRERISGYRLPAPSPFQGEGWGEGDAWGLAKITGFLVNHDGSTLTRRLRRHPLPGRERGLPLPGGGLDSELADEVLELFALEAELRGCGCGLLGALR